MKDESNPVKHPSEPDTAKPVTRASASMTKCPACGQRVESERYKLEASVFVWTSMTVLVWGMVLFSSTWTVAWFAARRDLIVFFAAIPVVAIYVWVRYLRERREGGGTP